MLYLLFQLGQDRYAVEASQAVEVVPLLGLRRLPQAPPGVAGVLNYRGRPVPAIDLCALTMGRPSRELLSTRIIVLRHQEADGGAHLVGVIAEKATELLRRDDREASRAAADPPARGSLGPLIMDEKGFLQLVRPGQLLSEAVRELLCTQEAAFSHEGD